MASLTMMASLSAVAPGRAAAAAPRRGSLAVARAAAGRAECQHEAHHCGEGCGCRGGAGAEGRRAVMFAAAAVALSAIGAGASGASAAFAESDVKRGTPEAKKKYAQICVTMPTAKELVEAAVAREDARAQGRGSGSSIARSRPPQTNPVFAASAPLLASTTPSSHYRSVASCASGSCT
uniref:Uncharacterized protein n=1 Tax=Oryza sativa subsp. japonica TaxID=39947 RepID=Q6EUN4_ORYSJ|nr:unknown protein [Oryza sativa Japonica Group]